MQAFKGAKPRFDVVGAVLSAAGLFFVVLGILQSGTYGWLHGKQRLYYRVVRADPEGRDLAGLAVRGHRRPHPAVVLPPHPLRRSGRVRSRFCRAAVPEPDVQPWTGDAERPVAGPAGELLRHLGLPADRSRLQRDRDRPDPHPRNDRHPAHVERRGQAREAASAANAHLRGVRRDHRRHAAAAPAGRRHIQRRRLPAGPVPDRRWALA